MITVPLFLLYNTDYVKGMLRPVFRFADCPVWEYDFAPHDVGRYPYAAGQVYGLNKKHERKEFRHEKGCIFPFYYQFPAGSDVYEWKNQMPVEECGNMLIMTAVVCQLDHSPAFAKPYYEVLKQWTEYLLTYGADPGEQLCTDDHYRLTFENQDSWSLKYNLIWDKFFESNLFSDEVYEKETAYYIKKSNFYGVPLDSRKDYTKSDWILWCAAFAPTREERLKLIHPVAEYAQHTSSRVPFSDWYETVTGEYCHFIARSVQGGIFMPMLIK